MDTLLSVLGVVGIGAFFALIMIGWFWFCKEHPFAGFILCLLSLLSGE